MASIERTIYPRLRASLSAQQLEALFGPTDKELRFVRRRVETADGRLTLLLLLKCHQQLGRLPPLSEVPSQIPSYLCGKLGLPNTSLRSGPRQVRQRYRELVHTYLDIRPYSQGGREIIADVIRKCAYTMSDPADLINAAIEQLIKKRFELPAYRTFDELAARLRQEVHEEIYTRVTERLEANDASQLDRLLAVRPPHPHADFTRVKEPPGRPTLTQMRRWVEHLSWLDSLVSVDTAALLAGVAHSKTRQFAAEAHALEVGDVRDIVNVQRRRTLLICLVHQARAQRRDDLATMFLKRMRRIYKAAKCKLTQLRDEHRELEEQMVTAFSQILGLAAEDTADVTLGRKVRSMLASLGPTEELQEQYRRIAAYHDNNYKPLLWGPYRTHRAALLRLVRLLRIQSTTHDASLAQALDLILRNQESRRDYLPDPIDLDFAGDRAGWKALVEHEIDGKVVIDRRQLEVCVLSHVAAGLRCGDLFVPGSEAFSDYREQLLPWSDCETRLAAYCEDMEMPTNASAFVRDLKGKLKRMARKVDRGYPKNKDLTIDAKGEAHLKRLRAIPTPKGADELIAQVRKRMPERHLLDILRDVHHWTRYTRHFGPPSGSDPKLRDSLRRYLFTIFGLGCGLGASQTARHSLGKVTRRVLNRINKQHLTVEILEAASRDIIAQYNKLDLPHWWGSGKAAIADGTHVELRENNLLGEQHIRYGAFGGIAYHHISDTYVALFSHFIGCGVWEAVHILDGLLKNRSEIQPDTLHADTQGQSEPVFGLALLLGIKLMPRMRTWNDVVFYRAEHRSRYKHIDALFTKTVDWRLIETHWQAMMQVVLSIQAGKVMPSMLLQRLGTYSRQNTLYRAFRELGRVARTLYLLEYVSDRPMRRRVDTATTKIESFNAFCDWISFGGETSNSDDPVQHEKQVKYTTLVANAVMLHNVVDLTDVLVKLAEEGYLLTPALLSLLSPHMTKHIKRFGHFVVDTEAVPPSLEFSTFPVAD